VLQDGSVGNISPASLGDMWITPREEPWSTRTASCPHRHDPTGDAYPALQRHLQPLREMARVSPRALTPRQRPRTRPSYLAPGILPVPSRMLAGLDQSAPVRRPPRKRRDSPRAAQGATARSPSEVIRPKHTLLPTASLSAISSTFNSLFKVLCIFPSRYLFAIGLLPIFSFM